jgi:YHS domain-containing protein
MKATLILFCGLLIGAAFAAAAPDDAASAGPAADPALQPLQDFVGKWKGVGQVRRGSTQGAWIEQADWRWDFKDGKAAIVFAAPESKHLVEGRITPSADAKLTLSAKTAAGGKIDYAGTRDIADGSLTFTRDDVPEGAPQRVVLRFAADKQRLVAALERRIGGGDSFARLAEVGYTRAGSNFGKDGGSGPVCIVTGGSAEIAVGHAGKTYYVCCTGCKDLFEEDPAKFVAAYEAKLKEKQKK